MATFGVRTFRVESENGMYPGMMRSMDTPRTYRCRAVVSSLAELNALYAAAARATFLSGLGSVQWVAIIEAGAADVLTVPAAGQGPPGEGGEQAVYVGALLTSIESEGAANRAGQYRIKLEFTLPELSS